MVTLLKIRLLWLAPQIVPDSMSGDAQTFSKSTAKTNAQYVSPMFQGEIHHVYNSNV